MNEDHRGVPYALTLGGGLADPANSRPRDHGYRCLACNQFVFLRRGQVRVAHFAHYTKRDQACSRETVLHEAAKLRLRDMLRNGVRVFQLEVPCPGYRTAYDNAVECSGESHAVVQMHVPAFDHVGVEVPLPPYRLDAAASKDGSIVLALEVYQSHKVEEAKRDALAGSGLPWLEVEARAVLEQNMPWRAVTSSCGEVRCSECSAKAKEANRERRRLEARSREQEEHRRAQELNREWQMRISPVAWDGRLIRFPSEKPIGARLKCPACKQTVTVERVDGKRVFLHAIGMACDPKIVWVKAAMVAIYKQLVRDREAVQISRHCSSFRVTGCPNKVAEQLPDFDDVLPSQYSLVLVRSGSLVGQIDFAKHSASTGAPRRWWLRPSRAVKQPTRWRQGRNGSLCPSCRQRADETEATRVEQHAVIRAKRASKVKRAPAPRERTEQELAEHLAREPQMLAIVRRAFARFNLDAHWAAEQGVVVRMCEHCTNWSAYVLTTAFEAVPSRFAAAFVEVDGEIRCRCMQCDRPVSNNHDYFQVHGRDYAGYEVRPDAIRGLASAPDRSDTDVQTEMGA